MVSALRPLVERASVRKRSQPPRAEALAARRLLAVTVLGTTVEDVISVTANASTLFVTLNGVTTTYPLASVDQLDIAGDSGDDRITIQSSGTVPIWIDAGNGDDRVTVGGGDWRANVLGNITVMGSAGEDRFLLDNSTSVSSAITIENPFNVDTQISIEEGSTLFVDAGTPQSAVELIDLSLGADADEVNLLGISSLTTLQVLANGGDDSIVVFNDFDSTINANVTVDGGDGVNALLVNDSADAFTDAYLFDSIDAPTFGKDSTASLLTYKNFATFYVVAGGGGTIPIAQSFRVNALPPGLELIIDGGNGDDALRVGSPLVDLTSIQSRIRFNGQAGFDRIDVYDPIGTTPSTYTVTGAALNISGQLPIEFTSLQYLHVRGNSGNNLMQVLETFTPTSVTLDGGAGNDTLRVGGGDLDSNLGNGVSVIGGSGVDSLVLDDQFDDAGNDTYTFNVGLMNRAQRGVLWASSGSGLTENVELLGSANADTLRISAANPDVRLRLNAGAGNDSILADRTSDGLGSAATAVTIVSGDGNDTLSVNGDFSGTDAIVAVDAVAESLAQLNVQAGGRLVLAGTGDRALRVVDSLTVNGSLDVNDQTLIVSIGGFTQLNTLVTSGYNGGAWSTAVQPAIVSTAASLSPRADGLALVRADALGYPAFGTNNTLPGDLIVRYTLAGDANLDRAVNFDDLLIVAQNYNAGIGGRTWDQGNFNYNTPDTVAGAVGFDDLLLLAQNYGTSLTTTLRKTR